MPHEPAHVVDNRNTPIIDLTMDDDDTVPFIDLTIKNAMPNIDNALVKSEANSGQPSHKL